MQETADNSNPSKRSKNRLPKDNLPKQENIKIHGIGLDKAGRCTHYHTQLDIAALLCAKCRKYYACYSCHDELEDHSFMATTPEEAYPVLCENCGNYTHRHMVLAGFEHGRGFLRLDRHFKRVRQLFLQIGRASCRERV